MSGCGHRPRLVIQWWYHDKRSGQAPVLAYAVIRFPKCPLRGPSRRRSLSPAPASGGAVGRFPGLWTGHRAHPHALRASPALGPFSRLGGLPRPRYALLWQPSLCAAPASPAPQTSPSRWPTAAARLSEHPTAWSLTAGKSRSGGRS